MLHQIKLTDPTSDYVVTDKIRWPELPANFSIILTDRPLIRGSEEVAAYRADSITGALQAERKRVIGEAIIGADVALISMHKPNLHNLVTTAAHEVGHLFEILSDANASSGHCPREECIMSAAVTNQTTKTIDTTTRLKRLKQRAGKPEFLYGQTSSANDFCGDCANELETQAPIIAGRMALKTMRNFKKL